MLGDLIARLIKMADNNDFGAWEQNWSAWNLRDRRKKSSILPASINGEIRSRFAFALKFAAIGV